MNTIPDLHPVIDVPQQLLLELAVGLDPFDECCERHGYTPEQADKLKSNRAIQRQISRLEKELRDDGVTFRMRAAHAAEDMLGVIWREAKLQSTSLALKLEALKTLAKLGGKEPTNQVQQQGSGFSITINLPGQEPQTLGRTIDVTPTKADSGMSIVSKNKDLYLPEDYEYA